jgi:hypothetical protein
MKKNHTVAVASLGVLALGAAAWVNARPAASSAASAPVPSAQAVAAAPKNDGFRASEFAGVSVRSIAASAGVATAGASQPAAARGWIGFRPGSAASRASGREASGRSIGSTRSGGWSKVAAPARFGGSKIVGPGLMHSEIGVRGPGGITVRECLPGESAAQHAGHTHLPSTNVVSQSASPKAR